MMIKKILKDEKGDILILSTAVFIVLLGFISLSIDIGLAYMYRNKILEIANVMRDTRFTKDANQTEVLSNNMNPGDYMADLMAEYARKNNFKGKVTINFHEHTTHSTERRYDVTITMESVYKTTTLNVFNIKELPIKVVVKGYGYKNGSDLWNPSSNNPYYTSWNKVEKTYIY
ncbi:MAG: hypothetical protein MR601_08270 [Erysipelotrichaceae bacterium]|nr:hypothetical protein [Erysipelotrichaceae bacterium]